MGCPLSYFENSVSAIQQRENRKPFTEVLPPPHPHPSDKNLGFTSKFR